ncbi:SDR family oxidoreductase [Jiella sp. 40Bstr34]|uniref:SDR family oxidoreductase n=1 Tax=Jiella pacifica TaxID=2696469 RepID=A0A6N9SZG1_9HYPH|nr:SDR family oxidoreductase [Jiella pacifica]
MKGRTALVTGSTDGLGLAIAEALAKAGANVAIHGLAEHTTGQAVAARLAEQHSVETLFDGTNLADGAAITAMIERIQSGLGALDIVVHNAVVRHFHPVEEYSPEEWDQALAVNLTAAFHIARLTLPGMKARAFGRIIHLSSIYGSRGIADRIGYVTTKTALLGMTRAIALEVAGTGVTCNALCPGSVLTPAIRDRLEKAAAAEGRAFADYAREYAAKRHPTGEFVAPEDVGAMAVFLCGPHSSGVTGASFQMDGGWQAA